jgi:hypothetical protein
MTERSAERRVRQLADRFSVSQQLGALQTHSTDTHTTDTHYRHTIQTHTTNTQYRHTLQTHITDTHYRHTHYRHALQTHTTDTHTTDTFLFISHTTNLLLFKSRCNIVIGVRIIKELPGLVGSGTLCRKWDNL